jgi:uncharacterized protein
VFSCTSKAAVQGHVDAQYKLGLTYQYGTGVAIDFREAGLWYHMAAEQRHTNAMYQLGTLYDPSFETDHKDSATPWEADAKKCLYWYTAAAKRGKPEAQFALALCFFQGIGMAHVLSNPCTVYSTDLSNIVPLPPLCHCASP